MAGSEYSTAMLTVSTISAVAGFMRISRRARMERASLASRAMRKIRKTLGFTLLTKSPKTKSLRTDRKTRDASKRFHHDRQYCRKPYASSFRIISRKKRNTKNILACTRKGFDSASCASIAAASSTKMYSSAAVNVRAPIVATLTMMATPSASSNADPSSLLCFESRLALQSL